MLIDWENLAANEPEVFKRLDSALRKYEKSREQNQDADADIVLEACHSDEERQWMTAEIQAIDEFYDQADRGAFDGRWGKYIILDRVATGGFGNVFKAIDDTGRFVALKITHMSWVAGQSQEEIEAEAKVLLELSNHAHIVDFLDCGWHQRSWYIVTEWIDGGTLREGLYVGFTLEESVSIATQICSAIQYGHDVNVVHRDVKPGNIMLSERDGKMCATLLDYGIARRNEGPETQHVKGSPRYMAPEQRDGLCDERSDIYSIGMVLKDMLAGSQYVPRAFTRIAEKATRQNPKQRFQTAREFQSVLERMAEGIPDGPPAYRKPLSLILLAIAIGVAALLFINTVDHLLPSGSAGTTPDTGPEEALPIQPRSTGDERFVRARESRWVTWDEDDNPSFVLTYAQRKGNKKLNITTPYASYFNERGFARMVFESEPPGAKLSFYPFSEYHEPSNSRLAFTGTAPVVEWIYRGHYLVTAEWSDGTMAEAIRVVPQCDTNGGRSSSRVSAFERTKLGLLASPIRYVEPDTAGMVLVNDLWTDRDLAPVNDVHGAHRDLDGQCVDITWEAAAHHLELSGKRLPFLSELESFAPATSIQEWTSTLEVVEHHPLSDGHGQRIGKHFLYPLKPGHESAYGISKGDIGFRGIRPTVPFSQRQTVSPPTPTSDSAKENSEGND